MDEATNTDEVTETKATYLNSREVRAEDGASLVETTARLSSKTSRPYSHADDYLNHKTVKALHKRVGELREEEIKLLRRPGDNSKQLDKVYRELRGCKLSLKYLSREIYLEKSCSKNSTSPAVVGESKRALLGTNRAVSALIGNLRSHLKNSLKDGSESMVLRELYDFFSMEGFGMMRHSLPDSVKMELCTTCFSTLFRLVDGARTKLLFSQVNVDYLQSILQGISWLSIDGTIVCDVFLTVDSLTGGVKMKNDPDSSVYFEAESGVVSTVNIKGLFTQCHSLMVAVVNYFLTHYTRGDSFVVPKYKCEKVTKSRILHVFILTSIYSDQYISVKDIEAIISFVSRNSNDYWFQLLYMYVSLIRREPFSKLGFYCKNPANDVNAKCDIYFSAEKNVILSKLGEYYKQEDLEIVEHFVQGNDDKVVELKETHEHVTILKLLSYSNKDDTDSVLRVCNDLLTKAAKQTVTANNHRSLYIILSVGIDVFSAISQAGRKRLKKISQSLNDQKMLMGFTPMEVQNLEEIHRWLSVNCQKYKVKHKYSTEDMAVSEESVKFDTDTVPAANCEVSEKTEYDLIENTIFEVAKHMIDQFTSRAYSKSDEVFDPKLFSIVDQKNKVLSYEDSKKTENRNSAIKHVLINIATFRKAGDIKQEFNLYRIFFEAKGLYVIGYTRVLEELVWSLLNAALNEPLGLSTKKRLEIVDLAWEVLLVCVQHAMGLDERFRTDIAGRELLRAALGWLATLNSDIKEVMQFTMRCLVGSTAGHIRTTYCEILGNYNPEKRQKLEQEARFFFYSKNKLQPSYVKPVNETEEERNFYISRDTCSRWEN